MGSPDAQLKYLKLGKGAFDLDLIDIAEKYLEKRSHVWDIGANVGVFTFAAAAVAKEGSVVSVEADIWLANLLRETAKFDDYSNGDISILPAAISDENSIASFIVAARGRASSALEKAGGRSQMGGAREKVIVPTLTLDTLLETFPSPDFVKIDVEGAELLALKGARRLIKEVRPKFYIEVGDDVSNEILALFQSAGYAAYDPSGTRLVEHCAPNTFFIPTI